MRLRSWAGTALRMTGVATVLAAAVGTVAATPAHASAQFTGNFVFTKNHKNPSDSRLTWTVYRSDLDPPRKILQQSWRAGSGTGSTNSCTKNHGWLPDGWYKTTLHLRYNGSKIKGVVFALDDKACKPHGTKRTELFIHSEMTRTGGQDCRSEPRCWNGDGDYKSNGCIKLKPADIKAAASLYKRYYPENRTRSNMLFVTG